jgi:hypothetical protein
MATIGTLKYSNLGFDFLFDFLFEFTMLARSKAFTSLRSLLRYQIVNTRGKYYELPGMSSWLFILVKVKEIGLDLQYCVY